MVGVGRTVGLSDSPTISLIHTVGIRPNILTADYIADTRPTPDGGVSVVAILIFWLKDNKISAIFPDYSYLTFNIHLKVKVLNIMRP